MFVKSCVSMLYYLRLVGEEYTVTRRTIEYLMKRIIFAGTPQHAVPFLEALSRSEWKPIAVISQPDRPAGRSHRIESTPTKHCAIEYSIPILQPENINDPEFLKVLESLKPDLMVVVAYGQILRNNILDIPTHGCINVHFSLLPSYRGASPVQEAILNGDAETGVTIIQMDALLDHGPILSQIKVTVDSSDTAQTLREKLSIKGGQLLLETVEKIFAGTLSPKAQNESQMTGTRRLTRDTGRIDWSKSAVAIERMVRALNPWPGIWTVCDGKRIKILKGNFVDEETTKNGICGTFLSNATHPLAIRCGKGLLEIHELQIEGKKPLTAQQFLHGYEHILTKNCL